MEITIMGYIGVVYFPNTEAYSGFRVYGFLKKPAMIRAHSAHLTSEHPM